MSLVTGVILAGGKSVRMKTDKAFLKLGQKTIMEELISRLERKFSKLIIIANDREKYSRFNIEVVEDLIPDKGPLGGIYTALVKSKSFYNFVFSCDTPFVNPDLIDYMITQKEGVDVILPRWNRRLEPLHAIYSKGCVGAVEKKLENNDLKVISLLSEVSVNIIEQEELERFDMGKASFLNINTPEDYAISRQV